MNRLRDLRAAASMTQKQLAVILNCAPTAVSKYELEQLGLDAEKIVTICDLFSCSADYLLGRSSSPYAAVSEEDAALLEAYHAASERDRSLVDQILLPEEKKEKSAVS